MYCTHVHTMDTHANYTTSLTLSEIIHLFWIYANKVETNSVTGLMDREQNHQQRLETTSANYTTPAKTISTWLLYSRKKQKLCVWKWRFWVPTLGERSHEEVVEIASHLGELSLAPFPALAHLGAAVVEVMIVMVVLVLASLPGEASSQGRRGGTEHCECVCV